MLSTTMIAKNYHFKAKPFLFDFLIKNNFIIKKDSYELTSKGIKIGGKYHSNEKGEKWIVWDEKKFHNTINFFKLEILKQYHIATIDHMIHIDNLDTILQYGLFSHNNPYKKIDISNKEVNSKRIKIEPIYHKSIHNYVPFYFNPRNAMLYRNQQVFGENIIILGFYNKIICKDNVIFTNSNAVAKSSIFTNDIT